MADRAARSRWGGKAKRGRISLWLAYGVASVLTSLSLYQRRASHLRHGISFAVMKGSAGVLATAAWFPHTASGPYGRGRGFLFLLAVDKHMNGVINCCSRFSARTCTMTSLCFGSSSQEVRYDRNKKTQSAKGKKDQKKKNATAITTTYWGPSSQIGTQAQGTSSHLGLPAQDLGWERGGMIQSTGASLHTPSAKGICIGLDGFAFGHGRYPTPPPSRPPIPTISPLCLVHLSSLFFFL